MLSSCLRPTTATQVSNHWRGKSFLRCLSTFTTTDSSGGVRDKSSLAYPTYDIPHDHHQLKDVASVSVPNFNDFQVAFETKSTLSLLRASLVFSLCRIRPLVKNAEPLLSGARMVFGDAVTDSLMKATLFGHFCAGEDERRLEPAIADLRKSGIGGILDYAAENDVPVVSKFDNQPAREYSYESEAACDRHVDIFKSCIRSVANVTPDGFAAIKITALGNPLLLERMSQAIVETKKLFAKFDTDGDGYIKRDEFERAYRYFFDDADDTLPELFHILDPSDVGQVDYITWSKLLTPQDLPALTKHCRQRGPLGEATPTSKEIDLMEQMHARAHSLAEEAFQCGTRLLIDAEQSYFQPAIDNLTLELQQTYNATDKVDSPIIFNTFQCYLRDTLEHIALDVERSERFNYHFACKLVRGAYMESERKRAEEHNYPSPIHDTIEDTHQCYNDAVAFLIRQSLKTDKQLEVMCATHNQESIEKAIAVMEECGIDRSAPTVHFAQLYGMSDNLTYNLGKHGFRAYKYVPYGEVKEVMPYLMRRAQENSAVTGSASRELSLLRKELFRRMQVQLGMATY